MTSYQKKGPSWDPEYWSGWEDTPPCNCPEDCRDAVMYRWVKVQMVSPASKGWFTAGRVFLGILSFGITEASIEKKDLSHECVIVSFKCKRCQHQFDIQYEIINEEVGKIMRYGHYKYYEELQQSGTINYGFAFVQRCYDEMWQNYQVGGHNCYHWARDFCCKLSSGNPDAYIYG